MNPSASRPAHTGFAPGPWVLVTMIVAAAMTRLLPHPPNFSPVEAIALFGGAYFASRAWALAVPLAAMLLSDIALAAAMGGTYGFGNYFASTSFWLVYGCIAFLALLGCGLRGKVSGPRVLAYSLVGSLLFFLVTNIGAWLGSPMYPQNGAGLMAAYAAGIPFFQWTVLGTLCYAALLFGGFALLRQRMPALRAQTV